LQALGGVAVLYGGYKASCAAASASAHKASAVMRGHKTDTELSKAKAKQKDAAKERQKRVEALLKRKHAKE